MTSITTKQLILCHSGRGDNAINKMCEWLNDPEVVKYSEQRHHVHRHLDQYEYISNNLRYFREINAGNYFIGTIAAHVDENNSVANVGILIGEKSEWGKGYGTEAWQAFCDHLLANGIRKIEAGAMACNYGMIRIFLKTGMHPEGRRSGHFLLSGHDTEVDLVQWARFL